MVWKKNRQFYGRGIKRREGRHLPQQKCRKVCKERNEGHEENNRILIHPGGIGMAGGNDASRMRVERGQGHDKTD
jgi:hypothetical protein